MSISSVSPGRSVLYTNFKNTPSEVKDTMRDFLSAVDQLNEKRKKVYDGEMRYSVFSATFVDDPTGRDKHNVKTQDQIYRVHLFALLNAVSINIAGQSRVDKGIVKDYFLAKCLKKTTYQAFADFGMRATVSECELAVERIRKLASKMEAGTFKSNEEKLAKK